MEEDTFCPECNRNTETVFDRAAGDEVCTECGLVLQARSMDETSEWRTFADDSGDHDPARVGGPSNPLLAEEPLTTLISGGSLPSSSVGRWQSRESNPDRTLLAAFNFIDTIGDRLGLVATIKDRAKEIYKNMEDIKSMKGKNLDAISAACLCIACRQEDQPRTVKEISIGANGAKTKEIGRAMSFIAKHLEVETGQPMGMGTTYAGDFLRRFCSLLGMTNQEIKAAHGAVQTAQELDIRRTPTSIAATVIYVITQLSDKKKPLEDIVLVTGVQKSTIKSLYKDLYPYLSRLIPTSFAKEKDLKKLPNP